MSQLLDLIIYVSSEDRVCPMGEQWLKVNKILGSPDKNDPGYPGLPLILGGWRFSTDAQKRALFIAHICYGNSVGRIGELNTYLRSLNKDEWHYCPYEKLNRPAD
jgi:hypothetical protein